jgi:hypothetical protein
MEVRGLRQRQQNVEEFLGNIPMPEDGRQAVARMLRNGGDEIDLSPADANVFRMYETGLHIEAGHCINF